MLPGETCKPMTDHRTLYVGTDHALYRARPGLDGRWRAEGVALAELGGVRSLLIDPGAPRHWWACTANSGVLVTHDEGISWREANHGISRMTGWCLARHPTTGELWYGAEPVSLFRSGDGGDTWTACESLDAPSEPQTWAAPRPPYSNHVRHIALGRRGLVLVSIEEGWLLRSEDAGHTWVGVREGIDRDCHATGFLPGRPDAVLASTGSGIFRSEDGGRSFSPSDDGLRHRSVTEFMVHRERPDVLFTAAAECDPWAAVQRPEGANGAFYRSDDCGRTWWRLLGGLRSAPTCVAGDRGNRDSFYVGTTDGSVWLTEDGGESFRIIVEGISGRVRHLLLARR